jgi:hypothetical protein
MNEKISVLPGDGPHAHGRRIFGKARTGCALVVVALTGAACSSSWGTLSLGGGGLAGGGSTIAKVELDPNDDPHDYGTYGDPAGASQSKMVAADCECMADVADRALRRAIDDVQGHAPSPLADTASHIDFMGCMTAAAPKLPNGLPAPRPTLKAPTAPPPRAAKRASDVIASLKPGSMTVAMDDKGNLTVGPNPALRGADRLQQIASSVSSALKTANLAEQTCNTLSLERATSLWTLVSTRNVNSGIRNIPSYAAKERARLSLALSAADRADALAAASDALAGALIESVHSGSGTALDAASQALLASEPIEAGRSSETELDSTMDAARRDSQIALDSAHEWALDHASSQRAKTGGGFGELATGLERLSAGAPASPATTSTAAGSPSTGGGEAVFSATDEDNDSTAIKKAVMGLMHKDVGAVVRGAAALFPKDSPIRHGLNATGSLLHGDVIGAISAASKMVPAESKMGKALSVVQGKINRH